MIQTSSECCSTNASDPSNIKQGYYSQDRQTRQLLFSSRMLLHASRREPEVYTISIYYETFIPLGPNISKQLAAYLRSMQGYIQESCVVFLQPLLPKESLHRLSILLLMFERALRSVYLVASTAPTIQSQLPHVESLSDYAIPGDQIVLIMVAFLAFFFQRTSSVTSELALPQHSVRQEIMIMMTVLFSLVCLESFLLWCFGSLLLFRTICWETSLLMMVDIWLGSVVEEMLANR